MGSKGIKHKCFLSGFALFIDIWKLPPREIVVGRDIDDVEDREAYMEQVIHMVLASPEPKVTACETSSLRDAIYNKCVQLNPWLTLAHAHLVYPKKKKNHGVKSSFGSVIGQPHAVKAITEAMERAEAGIGDPQKPLCTMLFMGPTGVGKTFIAKKMSEVVGLPLLRIDCSEYGEAHEYSKLIGAPPGYIGHDAGGRFDAVLNEIEKNGAVVLFDEIEKANVRVHDLILHVLDEGRFTTGQNKEIDFTHCYLVMTSNLGAQGVESLKNRAGFSSRAVSKAERDESYRKAMKSEFKPEFINRLDEIIVFNALSESDAEKITSALIRDLDKRVHHRHHCRMSCKSSAKKRILELGFSVEYGARELRRVVKKEVESCVAKVVRDAPEGSTIELRYKNGVMCCNILNSASA